MTAILLLLAACGEPSTAPASEPVGASSASGPAHDATPHAHPAAHDGEVKTSGDLHVEARLMPEGVMAWLTDAQGTALSAEGWTASATVQSGGKVVTVPMHPMGDHLHAVATLEHGKPAKVVITLEKGGKPYSVSYEVGAVGLSTHDHTSLHGGFVAMWGDVHVEWAPRADAERFFVSDAGRAAITADVKGTMEADGRTVDLSFDSTTGALEAPMAGAGTRPVTLRATVRGQSFELRFDPSMKPGAH